MEALPTKSLNAAPPILTRSRGLARFNPEPDAPATVHA